MKLPKRYTQKLEQLVAADGSLPIHNFRSPNMLFELREAGLVTVSNKQVMITKAGRRALVQWGERKNTLELKTVHIRILNRLVDAGGTLPIAKFESNYGLFSLHEASLITVKDKQVTITDAGLRALALWESETVDSQQSGRTPKSELTGSFLLSESVVDVACPGDCIHKQILDFIILRYPKLREIVETMHGQYENLLED